MSAWDEMCVAKNVPGEFNVPYVAGMNVTNLPTTTFSISQSIEGCNIYGETSDTQPLGTEPYLLVMWCPSMTAFQGPGGSGHIPTTEKLGGFAIKQFKLSDLETAFVNRNIFSEV